LVLHNVTSGYTTSPPCPLGQTPCFLPDNSPMRAESAHLLANSAGYADVIPSTQQTFDDVPYGYAEWLYIERVYLHGAMSGYAGDGVTINPCTGQVEQLGHLYFRPCLSSSRGQAAKFVADTFFPGCQ